MGVRRQAREAALQALFMCDFVSEWKEERASFCLDHFSVPKSARVFAERLCYGVLDKLEKVDAQITCASEHWSISRMGRVDRSILRVATYEILYLEEVPVNVAINEAIEIAKRFGSDESPVFINGVLDKVASMRSPVLHVEVVRDAVKTVGSSQSVAYPEPSAETEAVDNAPTRTEPL